MRMLLVAALCACLAGCDTVQTVLGHCELPEDLTTKSEQPKPTTPGMPLDAQHGQWAQDRNLAAKNGYQHDKTVTYVQENCQ